jgi:phosphoenolpyruvate carboxykinase (GTP)
VPLVYEAFDWEHGVFMGSAAGSETTAANISKTGVLRHDPFAMLPFCGYNMGDYFTHWLSMAERTDVSKLPRIFFVNWFRKAEDGHWLWPGYGENSRVLKWIFERVEGKGKAAKTAIGNLPTADALDLSGLDVPAEDMEALLTVDIDAWKGEAAGLSEYYEKFGDRLPTALRNQLTALQGRLDQGVDGKA